jgi:signal transduction histidine kinase
VARELHDDVCQQVTVLALELDRLGKSLPDSEADARRQATNLYEEVKALGEHVHGISHRLHSSKLGLLGLSAAVESFCKEFSSHHGTTVEFLQDNVPTTLPDGVAINLFRVLQEALSNVVKHSGASRCRVSLCASDDQLRLEVSDEGSVLETASALDVSGLGLFSMEHRFPLETGSVAIESTPGAGTMVRATIPLRPSGVPRVANVGGDRLMP